MDPVTLGLLLTSTILQTGASVKQAHDTEEAQEEANEIQRGKEIHADLQASRKRAKEARIARARVQQGAEATGTTGSSGELGALSSLQTQLGTQQANQTSAANTANALSGVNERLASKTFFNQGLAATGQMIGAYGQYEANKPK